MDAAYNSLKKTVLFVAAAALLLAMPICADAQPVIVINPALTSNTIQISNATCNNFQILKLTSTCAAFPVTVTVTYNPGNANLDPVNGNWLYALVNGAGTTATGAGSNTNSPFNATIPASSTTAGINLQIGLNKSFSNITEQAFVTLTPTGGSTAAPVTITVNYVYNSSCGGNTGSIQNGYITITPGTLTMTAPPGA